MSRTLAFAGLAVCLFATPLAVSGTQGRCGAPEPEGAPAGAQRPEWAPESLPEEVWRMVDRASVTEDGGVRRCLLEGAEAVVRAAVEEAPSDVDRRYALAVVVGLRADREGGRTKVKAASSLHRELRTILELDPDHARARHLLGRLHAGVMRMDRITRWIATNLLGGGALKEATWAEAERNLAFAEEEVPGVLDHHYELARLYQDTDRPALAVTEAVHVLGREPVSEMEVAVQEKARALLEELGWEGRP